MSPEPAATPPEPQASEVRALLARLPERQRLVLFLRYYADLDYDAIATALGISSGTVGATLHAAHAALRPHIQEVHC
jgi:RNA polymerase sigma factor (sigma-70 family)